METNDDAAVWKVNEDTAIVLTVDFFTPLVDDAYEFGRISSANAFSDVYAMGATPHIALNLLALDSTLGPELAKEILRGGVYTANKAHAFVTGGHTIDDDEPKYGMCVFGTVHPDKIVRNKGAIPGDKLYLTKPLGTALLNTAVRKGHLTNEQIRESVESMMELNNHGAYAMQKADVHAATDVTGFGLAGHLYEMLSASECSAELLVENLPLFTHTWEAAQASMCSGRTSAIRELTEPFIDHDGLDEEIYHTVLNILCDPQTSGGLLVSIPAKNSTIFEETFFEKTGRKPAFIGTITAGNAGHMSLK